MEPKDKVAFITGSTSGIGKAIAQKLLNQGCKVIISSEKDSTEQEVLKDFENPVNATYLKCDISIKSDIENAKEVIKTKFGKLDFLVCNAGIMLRFCSIDDITEEIIDKTLNVNLKGTFWTLKTLGNLIKETSSCGSIVNMTSVDGLIGEPYGVIYSATKSGIISLTKSFARYFKNPLVM
jgi:NAD(P)-dependent dehydrogenase (short-subunit alcohol dehydrogenase family)